MMEILCRPVGAGKTMWFGLNEIIIMSRANELLKLSYFCILQQMRLVLVVLDL